MTKVYKFLPHFAFIVLVILIFSPSLVEIKNRWPFFIVVMGIEIALIVYHKSKAAYDIALISFVLLIVWEFGTTKIPNQYRSILPVPERVFAVFYTDRKLILKGIMSSMSLLFGAMFLALIFGVSLGIIVGWFERPRRAFLPIAKVLSPIPPIVYNPYAIIVLPSFRAAQLFIVFCSFFWGIFINMVITVSTVDKKIMESARTLNTKTLSMFFNVLFPYSLPSLLNRLNFQLSSGFMVLTAAELIGATSGLGWFIQYYSNFADYTRVIAGIIMIGIVITVTNKAMTALQKLLIRWK